MSRQPRFEVVRSDAGWFARFRAANGRIVWVTETYQRRGKAKRAVEMVAFSPAFEDTAGSFVQIIGVGYIEVRDVDEREVSA